MKIDTLLLVILMLLHLVSTPFLALEKDGAAMAIVMVALIVLVYPALIYLSMTERRSMA